MRACLSVLLLLVVAGAFWVIWDSSHRLYITPETESAFLKNYTPQHVIERFQCNESSSHGAGSGAGAGRDFVSHQAGFNWFLAMRSDKLTSLMTALNDDLTAQLTLNKAQILSQSGDARTGFHYDYKLGKSIGSVTLSPVALDSHVRRATPLPKCMVDVAVKVVLAEKWYPKEQTAMQASLNNSIP
ncbi:MAG: hypothetical protein LAO30_14835 [Acidobacteriia bacterium]|nr:hypothetical protein [Terriglobia bacterium]